MVWEARNRGWHRLYVHATFFLLTGKRSKPTWYIAAKNDRRVFPS